jgi:hypothetical protein
MKFISRENQLGENNKRAFYAFFANEKQNFSDNILDGAEILDKPTVRNWIDENKVHQAKFLSNSIDSSRMFIGKQVISVRDEQRRITHICFIETKALVVCSIKDNEIIRREVLHEGFTQRATICLDKYTGKTYVLHCSNSDNKRKLFLNKTEIETVAEEIDFPFMVLEQPPIGHFAIAQHSYGLLSYKCRKTGKIFLREFKNETIEQENQLDIPNTIGGVDFALNKENVIFRVEAIGDSGLTQMISKSTNRGKTIEPFKTLDFSALNPDSLIPTNAPLFADYLGNFQIPVTATKDGNTLILNITPNEEIVEAIRVKGEAFFVTAEAFPRKPGAAINNLGIGNGVTDGLGLIVTIQSDGALLSSNSQAGGHHFPVETMLNFEMPKTFSFKVTNCYTKGEKANMVSMDYVFIEADELGTPVSQRLMLETWDMPLPQPVLNAKSEGKKIKLQILQDGWFEQGKTTIWLGDPRIEIKNVNYIDDRNIEIEIDGSNAIGNKITFEMKNLLYYHHGATTIE